LASGISDIASMFTGAFDFSGIVGTLNLLMIILVVATVAFMLVYMVYKASKYRIIAFVVTTSGEFLRMDRIASLKDKSRLQYYKFRKTRERIANLDFKHIMRDKKKQIVIMVKSGEGAYYQAYIPKKFYTVDGKTALPVIDPNVMRSAITTLANQQRKYRLSDTMFQKYGTHIAILIVCLVLVVGGYILLKKEEQLIGLVQSLIESTKGLQEAIVGKAIAG